MKQLPYKLCQQLKEVGYSQRNHNAYKSNATTYYAPTLEELIGEVDKLCVEMSFYLRKRRGFIIGEKIFWVAGGRTKTENWRLGVEGETPKIAVAKLYIELRTKK